MSIDEQLIGKHKLSYIYTTVTHPFDPDGQAVAVILDGKTFLFLEDTNDGYRSSLGQILVSDTNPSLRDYTYVDRDVFISISDKSEYAGKAEIYVFKDAKTNEIALEIGTDNIDDYYPSFVYRYNPEAFNENKKCDKCGNLIKYGNNMCDEDDE